jgi:hypothetical protein
MQNAKETLAETVTLLEWGKWCGDAEQQSE